MNTTEKVTTKVSASLNREGKITVLGLLKNYYDEQIFNLLIKEIYNSDIQVSLAAIRGSASIGNEVAIPHLYRMIEHGKVEQKTAAIRTLAAINAPSSIDKLTKYYNIFSEKEVRLEILKSINSISPMNTKVQQLNRTILLDPDREPGFCETIMTGLLEAGNMDLVRQHLMKAPAEVQRIVFTRLLLASSEEASSFILAYSEDVARFDPLTLGCYLCAYELKTRNPQQNYLLDLLQSSDPRATTSFLTALSQYSGKIQYPTRMFRLLLRFPFVDSETEAMNGEFLSKILTEVKTYSPLLLNEFIFTTATHLEAVFAKLKKQQISLGGVKEREMLLVILLAKIIEQYGTRELLSETQRYFKMPSPDNPSALVQKLRGLLSSAPQDDQHRLEACVPLFTSDDRKLRLNTASTLSKVNLTSYSLLRRLNRLIRVIGTLEIRNSGKKILEILNFARDEHIHFLEETCVVTLCQLWNKKAIEQSKLVFASPQKYKPSVFGYVRGARYVPPRVFANLLIRLFLTPGIGLDTQALIVDSLDAMNLQDLKGIMLPLIRAIKLPEIDNSLKTRISQILSRYGDSSLFQPLADLSSSDDAFIRRTGIKTLRLLAKKETSIPRDVLTHRLYQLLEDSMKTVQVEALLSLLALGDDYAVQILEDYARAEDEEIINDILDNMEKPISHELFKQVLDLINIRSPRIHEKLREILPEFSEGPFAEELRNTLVNALKTSGAASTASAPSSAAAPAAAPPPGDSLFEHAKLEFKFRRENAQILTVFFIDIVSYTEKSSQTDASSLMKLIQAFEEITLPTIEKFRGTLIKKMGDGLLATFKHPLNASLVALTVQKKIQEHNQYKMEAEKFNVRIGLNTGLVIQKDSDIFGDTVNVASRMETSANPGDILLTQSTYDGIREYIRCTRLGDLQVKGKTEAITTYSAEEILMDLDQILSDRQDLTAREDSSSEPGSLAGLRESVFVPEFSVPEQSKLDSSIFSGLQKLFLDMVKAAENIAKDYHEEFVFKQYLQTKWNELLNLCEIQSV
jgi:class 3 adenylate cyclase/HEAT repeat protein